MPPYRDYGNVVVLAPGFGGFGDVVALTTGTRAGAQWSQREMTLNQLQGDQRSTIRALARRHGALNVRVFGSVARGDNKPSSDIDFLVDLDAGRDLYDLGGLQSDLRDLLAMPVDLVEASCLHPYILDRVLAESIPL